MSTTSALTTNSTTTTSSSSSSQQLTLSVDDLTRIVGNAVVLAAVQQQNASLTEAVKGFGDKVASAQIEKIVG